MSSKARTAYILLCAFLDAQDETERLRNLWKRFVAKHPEHSSSLMGDENPKFVGICRPVKTVIIKNDGAAVAAERERCQEKVGAERDRWAKRLLVERAAERERCEAKIERLEEALHRIAEWSRAYPLSIFPKPDLKKAAEVLKANGMTLDAISAHTMRHVVESVGKIAAAAIKKGE